MNAGAEITVRGLVQGVGFRWYTHRRARELNLTGFTKNLSTGDVFVRVEGEQTSIEDFIDHLHRGPSFARVQEVEVSWKNFTGTFEDFQIAE